MFYSFFSLVYSGIKVCDENNNKKKGKKKERKMKSNFAAPV